jgi:hypothetical protein
MRPWLRFSLPRLAALVAVALVLGPSGYLESAFAQAAGYRAPLDGAPPAPKPIYPTGWDITFVGDPQPMEAQHGANCAAPPATHHVATLEDMVFQCNGHLMTAMNAGYGAIYLTPDHMLDFSQGEAVLKWDMSTLRTSSRDWVDVLVMPYSENMQLSFENTDIHLPQNAVHIEMGGADVFIPTIYRNGKKEQVQSDTYHTWDMILDGAGLRPDAARRDTFELRLSGNHMKFGMPQYGFWWVDTDIAPLNWNSGVVQLNHRSYNPQKSCNWDGSCGPNTWHWGNISLTPATPFTIVRADRRMVDADTSNQINFPTPAPANAFLRFVGIGIPVQYSLDGGSTWLDPQTQGEAIGKTHPEVPDNFWQPIPAGTQSVKFRGRRQGSIMWEVSDISYWVANGVAAEQPPQAITSQPLREVAAEVAPAPASAPAPVASATTVAFHDLSTLNQPLNGQYPANVIDWGSDGWWLAGPWAQFTTNSVSFNGEGVTSGTLNFVSPRSLVQLDADNGGKGESAVSLSCDGQAPIQATVPPGQVVTIKTGWSDACSSVTVTSSNGWQTNFDNFQLN